MPLRHHLRAEENIEITSAELRQNLRMRKFAPRRIAIHAHKTRLREELGQFLLEFFRTRTEVFDVTAPTFGADLRNRSTQITVMAKECAVGMIDERQ